jgi:cytochrome c oxidase subunit 4
METERLLPSGDRKTYFWVWLALVILTGLTVSVAGRGMGRWSIAVVLAIASAKAALVLNYFMHLKDEKGSRLLKWMVPGVLAILVLFIGFTFFDVAFR